MGRLLTEPNPRRYQHTTDDRARAVVQPLQPQQQHQQRQLVSPLTLRIQAGPGNNVLVTGPNGSGKSSLFRCVFVFVFVVVCGCVLCVCFFWLFVYGEGYMICGLIHTTTPYPPSKQKQDALRPLARDGRHAHQAAPGPGALMYIYIHKCVHQRPDVMD
jgi:hypothetical protein